MNVTKQVFAEFEKLYGQCVIMKDGKPSKYFAAAEAQGSCIAIDAVDGTNETVWDGPGGTMTLCQIGENGDFYANEQFFPIFHGPECMLVHGTHTDDGYVITPVQTIPYLHRFDVVNVGGEQVFVGATLAKWKENKDDWSQPGEIMVGKLNPDPRQPMELKIIRKGITKNHGFVTTTLNGKPTIMITGIEGIFAVTLPEKFEDDWQVTCLIPTETSEACTVDIDGDGQDEIAMIEGFHGHRLVIYKELEGKWTEIFSKDIQFGHGLWGGKLLGQNRLIAGWRQGTQELTCFTQENGTIQEFVLGAGGTSQFTVWEDEGTAYVLSADRQAKGQIGQLALYTITQ